MNFFSFDKGENSKLKNESNENKITQINSNEDVDQSLFNEENRDWDLDLTRQHDLATAIHNHKYLARERKTESESSDKKSKNIEKNETPKVTKEEEILKCMEEDAEELKRTYKPVR